MKKLNINESEKERILLLHSTIKKSLVSEQQQLSKAQQRRVARAQGTINKLQPQTQQPPATETQPQTQQPPATETQPQTQQPPVTGTQPQTQQPPQGRKVNCSKPNCNQKVLDVQVKLNDKCPVEKIGTKLVEDGLYGVKTQNAIKACTGVDLSSKKPATGTQPQAQQPATGTQPQTQQPVAGTQAQQPATGTQPQAQQPPQTEVITNIGAL
jgi:hypothetical protein